MKNENSNETTALKLVDMHHQYLSAQINLWAIFIAATVTTAGITYGSPKGEIFTSLRMWALVGFLSFAGGHIYLIHRVRSIYIQIERKLYDMTYEPLQDIIDAMASNKSGLIGAYIPHFLIDAAVILFILFGP